MLKKPQEVGQYLASSVGFLPVREKHIATVTAAGAETAAQRRQQALKTTYWATSDSMEFCDLRDALRHFGEVAEVTEAQTRAFFMALPGTTFGQGVTWGFDDTEVRDDIWRFAQDNPEIVKQALLAQAVADCPHDWGAWVRTAIGQERTCVLCGEVEGEDWMEDVRYTRTGSIKQEMT